jgi:predicted kinase
VVLVGLPGSGKSTWAVANNLPVLSSDEVRRMLMDDATEQSINRRVFLTLRYLLRLRLDLGRPVTCIDATHLVPWERRPYLILGKIYGASVEAVYFDVPVAVCLERNKGRNRVVPEDVVVKMASRMVAPSVEEGFAVIHRVGC